jgi:dTDP-4-amino-4,6-dideoxygalactose transaminase
MSTKTPAPPTRRIPMLDLRRQYEQIGSELQDAVAEVLASQAYILGPAVKNFELEAAADLNVKHAIGCASGTDALWLALAALEIKAGDAVVTTPFSFFATASCITRVGATPVFADVDPATLNLDPAAVEHALDKHKNDKHKNDKHKNAKAVIPVHLYGQCADMDAYPRIARERKVAIVEDAAQAWGAKWNGKNAGSIGDISCFSFYPTKNLSAAGDAGLVTTNDDRLAERTTMLRAHGSRVRYYHDEIGWNSRLDSMQATVLSVKLRYIAEWNKKRGEKACKYHGMLQKAGLVKLAAGSDSAAITQPSAATPIVLLATRPEAQHVYHQYVVRAHRRDELRKFLTDRGVGTEIYYPVPLHQQKCFAYLGYREGDFPESERAAREVLALPIFPELTDDEQQYVVTAIAEFYS